MIRMPSINPAWWGLMRITARHFVALCMNVVYSTLVFMIQLYVTRAVWEAV
ncbi:MAG: hypothetical protein ACR2OU_04310 [Thermomicrobiales bacterium]